MKRIVIIAVLGLTGSGAVLFALKQANRAGAEFDTFLSYRDLGLIWFMFIILGTLVIVSYQLAEALFGGHEDKSIGPE